MKSRRFFKRWNMFVKAFHSTIMCIRLTLKVKTYFGNSTPATASVSPERREGEPAHKKLQSKV
jgi:hypothetical protein